MALKALYYVTAADDAERVAAEGITPDGVAGVLVFGEMGAANAAARDVVRVDHYTEFWVSPDALRRRLKRCPGRDGSASVCLRIIRQGRVDARQLHRVGVFQTAWDRPTQWDYDVASNLGIPRPILEAAFAARGRARAQWRAGELTEDQVEEEFARRLRAAVGSDLPK